MIYRYLSALSIATVVLAITCFAFSNQAFANDYILLKRLHAVLGKTDNASMKAIEEGLLSDNSQVSSLAIQRLSERTDLAALAFISRALSGPNDDLRMTVSMAMSRADHPRLLALLHRKFDDKDSGMSVREAVMDALEGRSDFESLELVEKGLRDHAVKVRLAALRSMMRRTDSVSLGLIETAIRDQNAEVSGKAVRAITARQPTWILKNFDTLSPEQVSKAITALHYDVQNTEFAAEIMQVLVGSCRGPEYQKCRLEIASALAKNESEMAYEALGELAEDFALEVQVEAIRSLRGRSDTGSAEVLGRVIGDSFADSEVKVRAIEALSGRTDLASLAALERALPIRDSKVMKAVVKAIIDRPDANSLGLRRLMTDDPELRGMMLRIQQHRIAVGSPAESCETLLVEGFPIPVNKGYKN